MFYCCGITDKGVMSHNEDALLIGGKVCTDGSCIEKLRAPFIIAVSDGVSGELSGEVASKMGLENIAEISYSSATDLRGELSGIHRMIAEYSAGQPETRNMQATLCGIAFDENGHVLSFNVGDSRLYRYRSGRLKQLNKDQSFVQLLYEEGTITLEQRRTHVHRNIIFPAFGNANAKPQIDILDIGCMEYGDVLILCTDGLSDYVSPLDIEEIMELPKSLPRRLELLRDKALEKGGEDNITAAAVVYCGE